MKFPNPAIVGFSLLACFPLLCFSQTPEMIGNPVVPATGGTNNVGTAFILDGTVQTDGVIFAFSAYFRNTNPAEFQLWRPIDISNSEFKLVGKWLFTPNGADSREDIYLHLHGSECLKVLKGDVLGIFTPEAPSPITYTFLPAQGTSYQLSYPNKADWPNVGDVKKFDTLTYPYKFSAAAFIDTNPASYAGDAPYACSKTMLVPAEMVTTTPRPTPAPGPPGPSGPEGDEGATGPRGAAGPKGEQGQRGIEGPLGHPGVNGAIGGTGDTGVSGSDGYTGDTGSMGPSGEDGDKGDKGDQGPAGPPGETAKVEAVGSVEGCTWCGTLMNPYLILGVLIWLVLVTLILIFTIILVSCRRKQAAPHNKKMASSQSDLWKKYENAGYENDGYETARPNGDTTYSTVEEGKTAF